jgi:class 3 adenylate cyclase
MNIPETHYARTEDGTHIGYQVVGDGPIDLVSLSAWFSHLEINWEEPRAARFFNRLASSARLILFDRRGNGVSDPVPLDRPPGLDVRMDDVRAVMDAVGSERAVIYGVSESGALAAMFAAAHPDRTTALIIHGSSPRYAWAPDWPWGDSPEQHERDLAAIATLWGTEDYVLRQWPSFAEDPALIRWIAEMSRRAMSPGTALAYEQVVWGIDVRDVLPAIHVPTLVVHRELDNPEANRYFAEHIQGAEYVALPGEEHWDILGDQDALFGVLEGFIGSVQRQESALDRVLATVLFTDIVGSTEMVARLGDQAWGDLVERHHATVRSLLARHRGREVDTAGDGFFATFDGPARAVQCAQHIVEAVRPLELEIRAGVHTGEVQPIDGKLGGLGVVIGSRLGAQARGGEVLVSSTVKDLVAGSGLTFEDAGEHELKGVPDRWHLYRVVG